ncbi:unnamed protein product [Orchesella dallaii]|uniref:Uncharacterized protein n=1 Tax=Orchesella dallaii TaxID=48710 RepID=A0ABP1Q5W0_9HEXA
MQCCWKLEFMTFSSYKSSFVRPGQTLYICTPDAIAFLHHSHFFMKTKITIQSKLRHFRAATNTSNIKRLDFWSVKMRGDEGMCEIVFTFQKLAYYPTLEH